MEFSVPLSPNIANITDWVFDLDNTLYDSKTQIFDKVASRMTLFIKNKFNLEDEPASDLRRSLFKTYGSTMSGLVHEHNIAARDYLNFVHDIDLTAISPNLELDALLSQLPGRKFIFTSGCRHHVGRVLDRLCITRHFSGIQDIVDSHLLAKPTPEIYDLFLETWQMNPKHAIMFEDMACNLRPAHERGMKTVWIESHYEWAQADGFQDVIDWTTPDVTSWLQGHFR